MNGLILNQSSQLTLSPSVRSIQDESELSEGDSLFDELLDGELPINEIDERLALFQESDLIRDIFTNGTDLQAYTDEIDKELAEAEEAIVMDFNEQLPAIIELSQHVEHCDGVLAAMEKILGGFQERLSELNRDISEIQTQSREMQGRLDRRLEVHRLLAQTIDQLTIAPEHIRTLLEGQIGSQYTASVQAVQKNFKFMQLKAGRKLPAFKQVAPEHDKLRFKTAATIRQFFLRQLEGLGSLKEGELSDLHRLQREILIPFKSLYHTMLTRHPGVAAEIAQTYLNYSTLYYLQKFERYLKSLLLQQLTVGDKTDLIGNDDSQKKALLDFSIFSTVSLKDKQNIFTLGERGSVLEFPATYSPLSPHTPTKYRFEELFKSFNYVFSLSLAQEHLFLQDFFDVKQKDFPAELHPEQMFRAIFSRVYKRVHKTCTQYAENSHDAIGILLCIRLNGQFSSELRMQLSITHLDVDYFHATDRVFWPRFQNILNNHIASLKKSSLVTSYNPKDTHPHFLSRRYAEMAASMLTLTLDEPMLVTGLVRLRTEFLAALGKMKAKIRNSKLSLVFLLNNYDLIQSILAEHPFKSVEAELAQFKLLHTAELDEYIKEEMISLFGDIALLPDDPSKTLSSSQCSQLVTQFNQTYRAKLAKLNTSVFSYFPNLQHATSILHSVLAHIMLSYTKFISSIDSHFTGQNSLSIAPVSLHHLKIEIKKYRSTF